MRYVRRLILVVLMLSVAVPVFACRFWVGVGDNLSQIVVDQLVEQPRSLKALGEEYRDGWSVGYYDDTLKPIIWRGALASNEDLRFDRSVFSVSLLTPQVVFSHLRRASSGCVEGVPNPHPFKIVANGKTWLFGHNGGMKKKVLIDLIGKDYLDEHPPVVCTDNPPETWIDSELYFIYLMKSIEEHAWNVERGLQYGLLHLYRVIAAEKRYLNFFLTDGEAIWAFRNGTSLFYRSDDAGRSFVSSTIPEAEQGSWVDFPVGKLAVLRNGQKMKFIAIDQNTVKRKGINKLYE